MNYSVSSKANQSKNLRDEIESVLAEGIKLKTVEEGKREELKEKETAVYEEFKQLGLPRIEKELYPLPPEKKSRWRRGKKEKFKKKD